LRGGPMQIASSANRTCSACLSASEYTATVRTSSSLHAERMRSAISPRLATRIFRNMTFEAPSRKIPAIVSNFCAVQDQLFLRARADAKEPLAILHGLAIFHKDIHD